MRMELHICFHFNSIVLIPLPWLLLLIVPSLKILSLLRDHHHIHLPTLIIASPLLVSISSLNNDNILDDRLVRDTKENVRKKSNPPSASTSFMPLIIFIQNLLCFGSKSRSVSLDSPEKAANDHAHNRAQHNHNHSSNITPSSCIRIPSGSK